MIVSDSEPPIKYVLNKTRKDEKFGVVLGCRYFVRKLHYLNTDLNCNLQEGDEIIKVNSIQHRTLDLFLFISLKR
mgnify:CR=1 FL=1